MRFQSWVNFGYQFWSIKILKFWNRKSLKIENQCWTSQNFRSQNFDFQNPKMLIFKNSKIGFFKIVSEIYPTLKSHNFFAIGPILKISDVPESSESLLSHSRICFPGRFHESSPNRWIGNSWFWRLKLENPRNSANPRYPKSSICIFLDQIPPVDFFSSF